MIFPFQSDFCRDVGYNVRKGQRQASENVAGDTGLPKYPRQRFQTFAERSEALKRFALQRRCPVKGGSVSAPLPCKGEETEKDVISGIAALFMLSVPAYVTGRMIQLKIMKSETGFAAAFVTGSFVLFATMLFWQVIAVKAALSFSVMQWGAAACFILFTAVGLFLIRGRLFTLPSETDREQRLLFAVGAFLFLFTIGLIEWKNPYFGDDMTVEETWTILITGRLCEYHPGTGAPLKLGMELSAKLNFLPGMYAALCRFSGAEPYLLICRFIPVFGLLLHDAAIWLLLSCFLGRRERVLGMVLYEILLICTSGQADGIGFMLFYQGFGAGMLLLGTGGPAALAAAIVLAGRLLNRRKRPMNKEVAAHDADVE